MLSEKKSPKGPVLVVLGCGDLGTRLALRLFRRGWQVYGLRRNAAALPAEISPLAGDLASERCPLDWPAGAVDYLLYAASADGREATAYRRAYIEGLQHALGWLHERGQRPRRLLFVSSSSVYGQDDGEWVDEDSPTEPAGFSGRIMLEAEALALQSGLPASVVRLSGIYGPGRQWLLGQVREGRQAASMPPRYGNRIHIDDAAALLETLFEADRQGRPLEDRYLGVDDEPAPLHEVVDWLRARLDVTLQTSAPFARSAGSKRCSNARARALGWQPAYPSYREGYARLLEDELTR